MDRRTASRTNHGPPRPGSSCRSSRIGRPHSLQAEPWRTRAKGDRSSTSRLISSKPVPFTCDLSPLAGPSICSANWLLRRPPDVTPHGVICLHNAIARRPIDVRICRNEYFSRAHIYARTGILTHVPELAGDRRAAFSIVMVGNQIADYARLGTTPDSDWMRQDSWS